MPNIVTIAGSPASPSRSTAVLGYVRGSIERHGLSVESINVRDLLPEDLLFGHFDSLSIRRSLDLIETAQAIVIATPIYKAAYAGVLKAFLDLLPQDAFAGKIILPIATGGSPSHLLALDYALKPVLGALGAQHILRGVYILDGDLRPALGEAIAFNEAIEQRLRQSVA